MESKLFQPFKIGNMEIRNRFVRSATWDSSADDETGEVTDTSVEIFRKLGEGGIGLVVTAYSFVNFLGKAGPRMYGIHNDEMIPGLKRLVDVIHRGGAKAAIQLVHCGAQTRFPNPEAELAAVSKLDTIEFPHFEMTSDYIENLIGDYAAAAVRAKKAGFDAVQIHGAHGYGISQFLSPVYNKRTDKWGGSADNRRRFLLEVIRATREAVGDDYPLFIKLGVMDDEEGGVTMEEGLETARQIEKAGIEAIEISSGVGGSAIRITRRDAPEDAYYRDRAAAVKKAVGIPVIEVGGIRSLEMAEDIVNSGDADLISMCRSFIREPGLIARWERGETEKATCINCNKCFSILRKGGSLECGEDIHQRRKAERKKQS